MSRKRREKCLQDAAGAVGYRSLLRGVKEALSGRHEGIDHEGDFSHSPHCVINKKRALDTV